MIAAISIAVVLSALLDCIGAWLVIRRIEARAHVRRRLWEAR